MDDSGGTPSAPACPPRVELPPRRGGRCYRHSRRVRLSEAGPSGRLRLDAAAAYLQDVAAEDVGEMDLGREVAWVVRRTAMVVERRPAHGEDVGLVTWCSGTGPALAERRTTIYDAGGTLIEAVSLWVSLDPATMRPVAVDDRAFAAYHESAAGRRVRSRFVLPADPRVCGGDPAAALPWPLRHSDLDPLGHVNNSVAWALVEDQAARLDPDRPPLWGEVEYRRPLSPGDDPVVTVAAGAQSWVWATDPAGSVAIAARFGR